MRWCSCNFTGFIVCRCCLLSSFGFIQTLWTFVCMSPCEFSQCGMLDFGPCSGVSNCSHIHITYFQKQCNFLLPLFGPQSGVPSLHTKPLPAPSQPITESVTPIHPPLPITQPMSVRPEAHLSVTLLFLSLCGLDSCVCLASAYSFLSHVLWAATTVFDLQGKEEFGSASLFHLYHEVSLVMLSWVIWNSHLFGWGAALL